MPKDSGDIGDPDLLALENLVSFRLSLLAKVLERRLARLVGDRFGLSVAEYRVLLQVAMRPQSTIRAIAGRTLVDKAQVSRVVGALERQGLVRRSVGPEGKRSPTFTVSPRGRRLIRSIVPVRVQQEQQALAGLSANERDQLGRIAGDLFAALNAADDPKPTMTVLEKRRAIRAKRIGAD